MRKNKEAPTKEAKEKKEASPKKKKISKIIQWIVTGIFIGAAGVLVVFKIIEKNTGKSVFGPTYPVVLTDSMEPDYAVKDVLVVKEVDPSTLKAGDDITFYWDLTGKGNVYPMTHRLLEDPVYFENADENGGYHYNFKTHGINTHSKQNCQKAEGCDWTWQTQNFHEDVLIGKVTRKSWFMKAITSVWGLIILIFVPCAYIMITSVLDMFKKLDEQEKEEALEAVKSPAKSQLFEGMSAKEVEELKKEMLEEMLNRKK